VELRSGSASVSVGQVQLFLSEPKSVSSSSTVKSPDSIERKSKIEQPEIVTKTLSLVVWTFKSFFGVFVTVCVSPRAASITGRMADHPSSKACGSASGRVHEKAHPVVPDNYALV